MSHAYIGTRTAHAQSKAGRRPMAGRRGLSLAEIVVLCAIVAMLLIGVVVTAAPVSHAVRTTPVLVGDGDTLWTLAADHPSPGLTTAQNAELIARTNGLAHGIVARGRTLLVPATQANITSVASR